MKTLTPRSTSGSILIAVIFTMLVVAAIFAAIFGRTIFNERLAERSVKRAQAITYADGILENLFDQWRQAAISVTNNTDRTLGLANSTLQSVLAAPTTTQFPPPPNISLVSWSVQAATPLLVPLMASTDRPTPENGTKSSVLVRQHYLATVTVRFSGLGNNDTVTLQRNFVRAGRSIFSNFYFGNQPVTEMHPGPPMYISGTCYIGGDLYTAHDSLHFLQDVTYTGTQTLGYRPNDPRYGSTAPNIQTGGLGDNWDLGNPPHVGQQQKLLDVPIASLDPSFADDPISNDIDSNSNSNDDGYHEVVEEADSGYDVMQLDPIISERLVTAADYRIYVNSSNTVSIYKGTATTPLATSSSEYVAINAAISTNTALYDPREGDNVRLVTIDVGVINSASSASQISDNNNTGDGLTFYVKDSSAGSSVTTKLGAATVTSIRSRAVKLVNGAKLPSVGLSVVTSNPVYIQGDYNTGTTGATKPSSNTATTYTPPVDNPSPVVSGYNRAPAGVIADAVNILSNSWSDANSTGTPVASNTTINCAILAGTVPTTAASYSGGIENFPRFHEDWSSNYLTIYGAIAPLFNSREAKGTWSSASYSPPARRWYYDTNLQDINPPGFRVARAYERGRRIIR